MAVATETLTSNGPTTAIAWNSYPICSFLVDVSSGVGTIQGQISPNGTDWVPWGPSFVTISGFYSGHFPTGTYFRLYVTSAVLLNATVTIYNT